MPALSFIDRFRQPRPVVAVLRFDGVIGSLGRLRRGLTLAGTGDAIERAFKLRRLKAVALAVNSPGGSPVQSALMAKRIRDLAEEKEVPVYAFAEDVAASGGYWLALAADEIYAAESSIIGSIGVVSGGFGFTGLIKRLGIERRLHAAGEKKAMLDPFQPEKPSDIKHLKGLQKDIHESFVAMVRERRGKRLKGKRKELFSGAFWTGTRALEMGLIDGIGDLNGVMRDKFGDKVKLKRIGGRTPFWRRRFGFSGAFGGSPGFAAGIAPGIATAPEDWAASAIAAIEERLIWNRFGL
ncbi:MAG: S49 family peptidase [Proteobacteria bacterium]|nr:S49 family peptidase [Pseudomonadota bacterium]